MAKGFGLVSKNARDKAAEQAAKTLNSVDTPTNDNSTTQPTEPAPITSASHIPASISETDTAATKSATPESTAAITPAIESSGSESSASVSTNSEPSLPEPIVSESPSKPVTAITKREGKNKKGTEVTNAALNAARVTPRTHKLLNMITSIEDKTQSEVLDELITLHPLYKKLKDLV